MKTQTSAMPITSSLRHSSTRFATGTKLAFLLFASLSVLGSGCGGSHSESTIAGINAAQGGSGSTQVSPTSTPTPSPTGTPAATVSEQYRFPRSKQGVADFNITTTDGTTLDARYARLNQLGIGIKIYNFWWSALENSNVASSAAPVTCPSGFEMFPPSAEIKEQYGFRRYRCLSQARLAQSDRFLMRDEALGIQSAVVLWSAPERYQHPNCMGAPWAGGTLKEGCVPRDEVMDDYEDFVGLTAYRYNGTRGFGKVHHFVIWNENASATWFDYSPTVKTRGPVNSVHQDLWISKYADMLKRAHDAIQRTSSGVMIYASTDMLWETPRLTSEEVSHIGTRALLDGIWRKLGTSISWSVAVHPYGDPSKSPESGHYGFQNLGMVSAFQNSWLSSLGKTPSLRYPQAYLFASEQGWPQSEGIDRQAKNICHAHDAIINNPWVIGSTHNYFHSIEANENDPNSQSGQGAFYGLIPYAVPADLSTVLNYATGQAYASTQPAVWGKFSDHFCCSSTGKGCPASSTGTRMNIIGHIDETVRQNGRTVVRGWACSPGHSQPIDVHLYAEEPAGSAHAALIGNARADLASEAGVAALCGSSGSGGRRFEIEVSAEYDAIYRGRPAWVHGISPFGIWNSTLDNSGSPL